MKFSEWLSLREDGVKGPDLIKWGDTNAMMNFTRKNQEANPHAHEFGKPLKIAPAASQKKPVPPPPPVPPKKKMKK